MIRAYRQTPAKIQQALDNALNPDAELKQPGVPADAAAVGIALHDMAENTEHELQRQQELIDDKQPKGDYVSRSDADSALAEVLRQAKATIPNGATVNEDNELIMQRTEGDAVSELFRVELPQGGGGSGGEEKPWRLLDSIDFSKTENQISRFTWEDLDDVTDILMFISDAQNENTVNSGYTLQINSTVIANAFAPNVKSGTTNYWWALAYYNGLVWIPQKSNGATANDNNLLAASNCCQPYAIFKDAGKAKSISLFVYNPAYKNVTGTWEIWVR